MTNQTPEGIKEYQKYPCWKTDLCYTDFVPSLLRKVYRGLVIKTTGAGSKCFSVPSAKSLRGLICVLQRVDGCFNSQFWWVPRFPSLKWAFGNGPFRAMWQPAGCGGCKAAGRASLPLGRSLSRSCAGRQTVSWFGARVGTFVQRLKIQDTASGVVDGLVWVSQSPEEVFNILKVVICRGYSEGFCL